MARSGWSANYYPFGEVASQTGSNVDTRFDFTGQERDEGTGLMYFGARYYDPVIGRFLGVDPLAEKFPDVTPYHYTHNNPINRIDPTGMADEPDDLFAGINALLEGIREATANAVTEVKASFSAKIGGLLDFKAEAKEVTDADGNVIESGVSFDSTMPEEISSSTASNGFVSMTVTDDGVADVGALGALETRDGGKKLAAGFKAGVGGGIDGVVEFQGEVGVMKVFDVNDFDRGATNYLEQQMKPKSLKR